MTRAGSLLIGALAIAAGGCLGSDVTSCDGIVCPPLQRVPVRAGAYVGSHHADESPGRAPFPRDNLPYAMVIDRDAGVVTVTATRDGSVVVERWRIR